MNIYYFDAAGNYTKSSTFNPRDPIPRNSTFDEPLEGEGYNVWRNKKWVLESEPASPPPPPPEPIPQTITPRQARLALLQAGLLSQVDDAINSLESPAKETAQIEWEYATSIERDSAWINQLGSALGLDDAGIDDLFKTASQL